MWNVSLFTIGFIFLFQQSAFAKEIAGEIVSVSGIAFIRPDKSTGALPASPPKAKAGDNVYVGDVINTSSEGAVKILMRDKSIVDLGASSLFKVDEYIHNHGNDRKAKMDLMFGKVRVAVTKKIEGDGKFQIKTKGATMGVRGTEFVVKEDIPVNLSSKQKAENKNSGDAPVQQATQVTVLQGKVDVAAPPKVDANTGAPAAPAKTVSLTANMQLTTGVGVPAEAMNQPVKISDSQLTALKAETKIEDNTFAKAVTIEPMSSDNGKSDGRSPASESGPKIVLPPIAALPVVPTRLDVPGVPMMDSFNRTPTTGLKRLVVTIVTQQ